ncbi:hypothetical protein [Pseudomonas sp. H9]|uniref:hypothetical protein n=1 Tax=Pseudomonas sp. H9 TaxID=483968 RepID=UPI001057F556|nr:hypothetical protein [Pseudomonas sp. H9]TDF77713.1 hypothetical protein E1573_26555 [Pseudomonas sp. H9]
MSSTTHESSAAYQRALGWSVPSQWQPQLRADLNELQAYRALQPAPALVPDPDKIAAMKARALHAGKTKVDRKRAAVAAVVEDHMPQVVAWTESRCSRAKWLKRVMGDSGKGTGWRYIDNYLKSQSL